MLNMIARYIRRPTFTLALDIGTSYMKAMELEETGGFSVLRRAAIAPVPHGTVENGVILNKQAAACAIRKMLDKSGIRSTKVHLAVGGPNLVLRWIEMPALPDDDLREAVRFEARKHVPFPPEHAVVDFKILRPKARQSEDQARVLLIAVPRTLVDSRFETAELAGLQPVGMDIEPLVVLRALEKNLARSELAWEAHPEAILVFGSGGTDFYVAKGADLEFARRIPFGGRSLVESAAEHAGLNSQRQTELDELAILKRLYFNSKGRSMVDNAPAELISAIESEIDRLDQEIRRSCSYYQSLFPEGSYEGILTQVIIAGGLAAIEGFDTHLAEVLDLPVQIADPLAKIAVRNVPENVDSLNRHRSSFVVSSGLLLV